jgi:hypothetical protein
VWYTVWVTHSLMELSPTCETELPSSLWNMKVHYRVRKSPPLVPILNHINPIHTIPSYLRSILILSTHLRLGSPSGLPLAFQPIYYMRFSSAHSCYISCPSHRPWLDFNYTWWRVQVMTLLVMQFSPNSYHLLLLRSKYSSQHPVLKHPQSMCLP